MEIFPNTIKSFKLPKQVPVRVTLPPPAVERAEAPDVEVICGTLEATVEANPVNESPLMVVPITVIEMSNKKFNPVAGGRTH